MAWDSSRPVPWERLIREWLIYAGIMTVIFLVFFRGNNMVGAIAGVLVSGPLYLAFGSVLAKFGYTRKSLKQLRAESAKGSESSDGAEPTATSTSSTADGPRAKPAPTSRTSGGGQRPKSSSKRKR